MTAYRETPSLRITRFNVPQYPFWPATVVSPYGRNRSKPVTIDYLELIAQTTGRGEVTVCSNTYDQLSREELVQVLRSPILIDAAGEAEAAYGQGAAAARYCGESGLEATTLISAESPIPRCEGMIALSAWPPEPERIRELATQAESCGAGWGLVVPVIFPVTTDADRLERLADIAAEHGARFFTGITIDLEPSARQTLASSQDTLLDDEAWSRLFDADPESTVLPVERRISAIARARGLDDFVTPPRWQERTNWNGAVVLSLAATRLIRLKEEVELGWNLIRSAQMVALLDKPIAQVSKAVGLTGVPGIDPASRSILESWLEGKESAFLGSLRERWEGV